METPESRSNKSPEDIRKDKRAAKLIGAAIAGTTLVVGSLLAFGSDGKTPKPTTTTEAEAPAPSTETTTPVTVSEDGLTATPENPEPVPAEVNPATETTVPGDVGAIATPENPEPVEAPAENN